MDAFELVFEVESICHAADMIQVLSEAYRVLKPGGRFVVIDGFRQPGFDQLDDDIQTAARLVEITLSVSHPWIIDEWLALAQSIGFDVSEVEDVSEAIIPNLMRFQFLARGYYKLPCLSNLLLRVLPLHLVKNSVAGLLMPFTVRARAQGYYIITLSRE
jgi:SAM-dependent methyltransferase